MRLQVADDLQTVLERPQEPIGVGERICVGPPDVPFAGERREGAEGVGLTQPLVPPAVDDLQELDRELHVADPAVSALDLDARLARGAHVLLQTHLHAADLVDRRLGELGREDDGRHGVDERRTEVRVSRHGARLDHRLALPRRGLARVVLAHRFERSRERPTPAPRPKRRIDAQRDPLGRRLREQPDEACARALRRLLPFGSAPLVDEHDVDIRRVVELGAAELAERDHRHARGGRIPARRGDAHLCDVADLADDLLQGRRPQIPRRHAQHRAPAEPPQRLQQPEAFDVARELRLELRL